MNMMLLDDFSAAEIEKSLPDGDSLNTLAAFFDALSDITRLKIVSALSVSTLCVTDLATLIGVNQTTVSHNLRILKSCRIVSCKRQGKVMFYSLGAKRVIPAIMGYAVTAALEN